MERFRQGRQAGGSALVVVLWVIGLLSMLVMTFAFDAHIEARITSYYRKRLKSAYLALSGVEMARMLMTMSADVKVSGSPEDEAEKEEQNRWYRFAKRLSGGGKLENVTEDLGEGTVTISIIPEPARRNINALGQNDQERERQLEKILGVGGIPEEMWPTLIDSFLDWIDTEVPEVTRDDGGETDDYYATLDPPYKAKNGPLDTVEELLLVKGFSRTLLYGGVLDALPESEEPVRISGIADLLTVYGDGKVNVNAAPMRVLMTLPDVDDVVAGAIIEEREGLTRPEGEQEPDPFENETDFCTRMDLPASLKPYVTTAPQSYYRVTSAGEVQGVARHVWCIVRHAGTGTTVLRWREEE